MKGLFALTAAAILCSASVVAQHGNRDRDWDRGPYSHVLLISVDGMHAVDFLNCSQGIATINGGTPYCPNLAALGATGVNYVAASTSKPSDSFPGLMNIATGATPRTMGVYYDIAYDRSLDGPKVATWYGNGPATCTAGSAPTGFTTEYDEGIDIDYTKLNGGNPNAVDATDGGIGSLDVTRLDQDPAHGCAPVLPWDFVHVNSVFGLVHAAGGYVAWSDKHPSYSSIAGHGGQLDDYYSPEINSNVINLPMVTSADGLNCSTIPDPSSDTTAWTNSFLNIKCYDQLKVNAVVNWINGKWHIGHKKTQTPVVFGMNFQSVSVGEKLIENGSDGGYLDAAGTPTSNLLGEIEFVDDAIGQMVSTLKDRGILDRTLIIITAKHGQSPIDPAAYKAIPGKTNAGLSPATLIANNLPAAMPPSENPTGSGVGSTEDDVSLLWLTNPSYTDAAVTLLQANRDTWGNGQIYFGPTVALNYDVPGLPPLDPRTPDIIVTPSVGVTYTGSNKKLEEHGGFSHDDINVMLLLSNPRFKPQTVYNSVATTQVAPTILKAVGLNPNLLDGVRLEGTTALPAVHFPSY